MGVWTKFIWITIGTSGGHYKCGNGPSGFLKGGDFLDSLSEY